MSLLVNLDGVRHAYRLCFVRTPWAFLTRVPLDQQWGEYWERAPYQESAGDPYDDAPDQILKVAFDGPLFTPDAGRDGPARSVLDINAGRSPWLRTESYAGGPPLHIMAGVTLESFVISIELAGGCVYVPVGWGVLPASLSVPVGTA
jgi:hypothetical protein